MPRLIDLNPEWVDLKSENRHGLGIIFDCMVGTHFGKKCDIRNVILFANPLDDGLAWPGESRSIMIKLFEACLFLLSNPSIYFLSLVFCRLNC